MAGFLATISGPVAAQDALRGTETPETLILPSQPKGIRAGGAIIYPQIEADLVYDDNIYNRDDFRQKDTIARLRGNVAYELDLSRHKLVFETGADVRRYFDITTENSEQFWVRANGVLELPDQQELYGNVAASRLIEPRGTFGDQLLTDEPIAYFEKRGQIGYSRNRGVITFGADLLYTDRQFEDAEISGSELNLSGRDVAILRAQARLGYQLAPRTMAFARVGVSDIAFEIDTERRNSRGYSVLAGLRWKPNAVSSIEAAVGYLAQNFEDPSSDFSGIDFYVRADWVPIARLRVTANAARSAERSALLEVPAVILSRVDGGLEYAIGDKSIADVAIGFRNEDYRGINRSDNRIDADFDLRHRIIENVELTIGVGWRRQWATTDIGREYSGVSARIGARLRF